MLALSLLCGVMSAQAQLHTVTWTDLSGVTYDVGTNTLTKTAANGWSDGGARSTNFLDPNTDGYIKYIATADDEIKDKVIGLSTINSTASYTATDYALMISGAKLSVWERGSLIRIIGSVKAGDALIVDRTGSKIYFKKNGVTLGQLSTDPAYRLYVDVNIYNQNHAQPLIEATFEEDLLVNYTKVDSDCSANNGSIDLQVIGGTPPYTYTWDHGPTTATVTGLTPGIYNVLVEETGTAKKNLEIEVYADVEWTELVGMTVVGTTIRKNTTGGWNTGAAISTNNLGPNEDGAITWQYDTYDGPKIIGFSYQDQPNDAAIKSIDYGLWIAENDISILLSGFARGFSIKPEQYDVFRIAREGSDMVYYRNAREFFRVETDADRYLVVDIAMRDQWSQIEGLEVSFCYGPVAVATVNTPAGADGTGTLQVLPQGGQAPYSAVWADLDVMTDAAIDSLMGDTNQWHVFPVTYQIESQNTLIRSGLASDDYTVTIADANNNTDSRTISLGNEIGWHSATGVATTATSVVKTGATGWGTGQVSAANEFATTEAAWINFAANETQAGYALGLRESTALQAQTYSDLDYGIYLDNADIKVWDGTALTASLGTFAAGDEFSVKRDGSTATALRNGTTLHTGTVDQTKVYVADAVLNQNGSSIDEIKVVKGKYRATIDGSIAHRDCDGGTATISLAVSKPTLSNSYSYAWTGPDGFTATTESVTNLLPGTYSVTATHSTPVGTTTATGSFEVGYEVVWAAPANVIESGNTITRQNVPANVNAGDASQNVLTPNYDGWAEFTIPNLSTFAGQQIQYYIDFGLSTDNTGPGPSDIEYGITIIKTDRGQLVATHTSSFQDIRNHPVPFKAGDKVRVGRLGSLIYFELNGVGLPHTITVDPSETLIVDATISYDEFSINDALTSFPCTQYLSSEEVPYATLQRQLDGSVASTHDKQLRVRYDEEYAATNAALSYTIRSLATNAVVYNGDQSVASPAPAVNFGANWLAFDFCQFPLTHGYYVLEVVNEKNEKWYLRFLYDATQQCPGS